MRLIDVDKLIYQSHAQHIQPYINKKDIDDAPTVEMAENCISREAVIEDVIKCTDMNEDTMEVLEDKVRALQSVTPKTGHWMTDVYKFGRDRHTCSNCGEGQEYTTPFCSWCGADMREKQAESEEVEQKLIYEKIKNMGTREILKVMDNYKKGEGDIE